MIKRRSIRVLSAALAASIATPALASTSTSPSLDDDIMIEPMPASAYVGKKAKASLLPSISVLAPVGSHAGFFRSFSEGDSFGNSDWGAAYSLSGLISGTPQESVPGAAGDILEAKGSLRGDATLFGKTKNIAEVRGHARSEANADYEASFDVMVLGANVFSRDTSGSLSETKSFPRTFFTTGAAYTIYGITLSVQGSVVGSLGYTVSGGPNLGTGMGGLEMHFTPRAAADVAATASASVLGLVGVGVTGELNLLTASLPVNAELSLERRAVAGKKFENAINYAFDSSLAISTLSGKLTAFLQLLRRHEMVIADWAGISNTFPIYNTSGSVVL